MKIIPFKIITLKPPRDNLREAVLASKLKIKEGDIIAIASKVISIDEGRCVPVGDGSFKQKLIEKEADFITNKKPKRFSPFTLTKGVLIRSAGIDESNGNGHYILWPKNPDKSALSLVRFFKKKFKIKKIGVIITDSISTPLRFGAIGFALSFAGFEGIHDYRGKKDIFGREFKFEQANLADALASAAVIEMGEGAENKPVVILRDLPKTINFSYKKIGKFRVPLKEDFYYELFKSVKWRKGKGK